VDVKPLPDFLGRYELISYRGLPIGSRWYEWVIDSGYLTIGYEFGEPAIQYWVYATCVDSVKCLGRDPGSYVWNTLGSDCDPFGKWRVSGTESTPFYWPPDCSPGGDYCFLLPAGLRIDYTICNFGPFPCIVSEDGKTVSFSTGLIFKRD